MLKTTYSSPLSLTKNDSKLSRHDYIDRLFGDFFGSALSDFYPESYATTYGIRSESDDNGIQYTVDIPGVKKEDLVIEMQDNMITVKGERKTKNSCSSYTKSFSVPEEYNLELANAELVDGILSIDIPKREQKLKEVKRLELK